MVKYRLCHLQKGHVHTVSYIPQPYAVVGKILSLKKDPGWEVMSAGNLVNHDEVMVQRDLYRHHRDITDV